MIRLSPHRSARPAQPLANLYSEVANIFVAHPKFTAIESEIDLALTLHGSDDELPCLHISGPPGIGKTTLRKRLSLKHPPVANGRRVKIPPYPDMVADHIPLLQCEMPPEPTPKSVAMQMLKALHDERWYRGSRCDLDHRLDTYLSACGTRAILVDEAQRAVDRNGTVVADALMDWFKARHGATGISIVFLGLGRLRYLFEQDAQIERRWNAELRMEPYHWTVQDGEKAIDHQLGFVALLVAFVDSLPFALTVDVRDYDIAKRFMYASRGVAGNIKKLLKAVAVNLMQTNKAEATMETLATAFDKAFRKEIHSMINPFGPLWNGQDPLTPDDDTLLLRPKKSTRQQLRRDIHYHLSKQG